MAIDEKYGRVTLEHGSIGEDEPVFVFRARDSLLSKVLAYYHLFCMKTGSSKQHLDLIFAARERVLAWQQENGSKLPDSGPTANGTVPPRLPLYLHVGSNPVTTDWTKSVGVASPSCSPLYTFAGDVPGGRPWGVSSDWQHYTGSVDYWQMGQNDWDASAQAATASADQPHACSPTGYCPPTDEAKATDTKANLMVLALATDDTTKKEELQSVLNQLAWVELTSRADAHRQLDTVLDMFASSFGERSVSGG